MDRQKHRDRVELLTQKLLFSIRPPGRVDSVGAGILLEMAQEEIAVLIAAKHLKPLGNPTPKAAKWFLTSGLLRLAENEEWMSKATKLIQAKWRERNQAQRSEKRASAEF